MDTKVFISALTRRSNLLFFSYDLAFDRFVYTNSPFLDFFSIKAESVSKAEILGLLQEDDIEIISKKVKECMDNSQVLDVECRFIRHSKEHFLRIDAYLEEIAGKKFIIGHAKDVTTYREYVDNLNHHNSKKNSILNILAHDLSGPIGTVGNLSELVKKETSNLQNVKISRYLDMINEITKRSINLIRNFVNQEFLESQAVNLLKKRVELVTKISIATEEYFHFNKHSNIKFSFNFNKEKIYVDIDEDKFLQVISNLISNAVKFTPAGGSITIFIKDEDQSILISVADSGIGIPEEFHKILFNKFTDARRPGLNGEKSTGLGMSIIKTIIEWHEGKIWFESTVNEGTTFYIRLPK
jgi:two-component system sensor histidine kinase VicK